jgi:hypothetical protein
MGTRSYRVTASALNLRAQPTTRALALALLPHGQAVARLDEQDWNGWWWVFADVPGVGVYEGYVFAEHLADLTALAAPPGEDAPEGDALGEEVADPAPGLDEEFPIEAHSPGEVQVNRREDGVIRALNVEEIGAVFGKFPYEETGGGLIKITNRWAHENIIMAEIPDALAHLGKRKLYVHRKAAAPFQRVFAAIHKAGLSATVLSCDGTFNPRHQNYKIDNPLSSHAWAIAIDLNSRWNRVGVDPPPEGEQGSVRALVPFFEAEGFAWGGNFRGGSVDGMHFELARVDL